MIRRGEKRDAPALAAICNHYIAEGHRVLREEPVAIADMEQRIGDGGDDRPAFVLEQDEHIFGYSYASDWQGPKLDPATLETTIYLAPEACGRGLGRTLYATLLEALEERGVHTAIACIALPNDASIALHASLGFTQVLFREGGAEKFGRSFDVEYWARRLESSGKC